MYNEDNDGGVPFIKIPWCFATELVLIYTSLYLACAGFLAAPIYFVITKNYVKNVGTEWSNEVDWWICAKIYQRF